MSDTENDAKQALLAAIDEANPHLADSKEQVAPAATDSPDVEEEEGTEDEGSGETETESEGEQTEEGESPANEQKRPSRKERARIKLNQEIARRIEAEQKAEQLQRERDQALAVKSQQAAVIDETPKVLADFGFNEDAYLEYKAEQRFLAKEAQRQRESEANRVKQAEATFAEKAGKFREEAPDFDEVALKTPLGGYYTQDVIEAIRDGETGPQLAYYLGQNLAETEQLLKMPPAQRARAIGRIEAKLEAPATAAAPVRTASQPPRTVTRAPAVGTTVTASSPVKKEIGDMSIQDHIAALRVKRK